MVVGVNGSGKTTSIAKLTYRFISEGKSVVLGAGDTFRHSVAAWLRALCLAPVADVCFSHFKSQQGFSVECP
jgi:signal recognition particle GTPase